MGSLLDNGIAYLHQLQTLFWDLNHL